MFSQLAAVVTHHVSNQRLEMIRAAGTPVLIVAATEDKLVRLTTGSQWLAEALLPFEYVVLPSGHGVNVEQAAAVNEAMQRLFEHTDPPTEVDAAQRTSAAGMEREEDARSIDEVSAARSSLVCRTAPAESKL